MADWDALLAQIPLFQQLNDADREVLAEQVTPVHLGAGRVLFEMGELGDSAYIVRRGQIRIFLTDSSGTPIHLATLGPGEIFGEVSLLDGGPRTASAMAVGDVELLALDRQDLLEFLIRRPGAALDLLTVMGRRLRETNQRFRSQSDPARASTGPGFRPIDGFTRLLASPLAMLVPPALFGWWLAIARTSENPGSNLWDLTPLMAAAALAVLQLTLLLRLVGSRERGASRGARATEEALLRIESNLNRLNEGLPGAIPADPGRPRPAPAGSRSP